MNINNLVCESLNQKIELQYETIEDLKKVIKLADHQSKFKPGKTIVVNNKMQQNYTYVLKEPIGKNFATGFSPAYTPGEMLELGVFEGKYCNDCILEYPREWFETALKTNKLHPMHPNPNVNKYGVKSRQALRVWKQKGWIYGDDPRGWFEWYMRYYLGRRDARVDSIQIRRWKHNIAHLGALKKQCPDEKLHDGECGLVRKQLLLQWSYPIGGHISGGFRIR